MEELKYHEGNSQHYLIKDYGIVAQWLSKNIRYNFVPMAGIFHAPSTSFQ
jgi:hypothetical protein